jgi:hypothetical protein
MAKDRKAVYPSPSRTNEDKQVNKNEEEEDEVHSDASLAQHEE